MFEALAYLRCDCNDIFVRQILTLYCNIDVSKKAMLKYIYVLSNVNIRRILILLVYLRKIKFDIFYIIAMNNMEYRNVLSATVEGYMQIKQIEI